MLGQEIQESNNNEPRFYYGYIVVAVAFIIIMLGYGTRYSFGIFFKPVLTEFEWTRAMVSGAFSLSMIFYGLLGIVMGGLNDKMGPRIVLTLSGILIGLGYFLMSLVSSVWQFYLFYGVIIGTGMGGYWVPTLSTVARWFTKRRSMFNGIVLTGTGLGTLIIPLIASRLIPAYDWRISFIIIGGFVLVIFVFLAQFMRRDPAQMGQVSYHENREGGQGVKLNVEGFSLGEAIHTRQFWLVFPMFFCIGVLISTVLVHIVPHATDLGISPLNAANILAVIGGMTIVSMIIVGTAADRIGNRKTLIIGFIVFSAAFFWLLTVTEPWMFYLFAVFFGLAFGSGALGSPFLAALFGLRAHGLILGVVNLGYNIGAATGPLLAGYIFDITDSYRIAFLVCVSLSIIRIVLVFLLRPTCRGSFGVKL